MPVEQIALLTLRHQVQLGLVQVENPPQQIAGQYDQQRRRHPAQAPVAQQGPDEKNDQTDTADQQDLGVQVQEAVWEMHKTLPGRFEIGSGADQRMYLAGNDDDADGGQHAVGHRGRKECCPASGLEPAESDLQPPDDDDRSQGVTIAGPDIPVAQRVDRSE